MLGISRFLTRLFTLAATLISVSGSIYGTQPIASTVWSAGRLETVSWIDDGRGFSLKDIGQVDIDLYVGDTYIASLAKGVDATRKSHKVWISPTFGHNGSDFYILFTSHDPFLTVYTADFTITNMAPASKSTSGKGKFANPNNSTSLSETTTTTSSASLYTPLLTLVLPNTTYVSQLAPTMLRATPSYTVTSMAPVESDPPSQVQDQKTTYNGAGASGTRVDMERLKFRLVFILWPALIGLSMAL